jgi:hypothetical protein
VNGGTAIAAALNGPDPDGNGDPTSLHNFSFRQSTSSNNETIRVDNLTVMVPEPTTGIIALLGVLGMILMRRKR